MTDEFNLSDKIGYVNDYTIQGNENSEKLHPATCVGVIEKDDVKEFIKRLKEEISENESFLDDKADPIYIIDNLAGDKLI